MSSSKSVISDDETRSLPEIAERAWSTSFLIISLLSVVVIGV